MSDVTETLPPCPSCASVYTYEMGALLVCPECGHEWSPASAEPAGGTGDDGAIRDAVGNVLADGDTVTVTKTLKVKGSPSGIKALHQGTQHPPGGRCGRPRHRLQDRRVRPHAAQVQRGQESLTGRLGTRRRTSDAPPRCSVGSGQPGAGHRTSLSRLSALLILAIPEVTTSA